MFTGGRKVSNGRRTTKNWRGKAAAAERARKKDKRRTEKDSGKEQFAAEVVFQFKTCYLASVVVVNNFVGNLSNIITELQCVFVYAV